MEKEELLRIIKNKENEEVEFKESFHSTQDISKAICAFANTNGGLLIIGVDNQGSIKGITEDPDKLQQKISAATHNVHPTPASSIKIVPIEGKKTVVTTIQRTDGQSFYSLNGAIFVRVGSTNRRLEAPEMVQFLQNRQILCFDETYSQVTENDIDKEKIEHYLRERGQDSYLRAHSTKEFLINSGLARKNGTVKIKNAAILLFAKNPCEHFPQAEIKIVKFKSEEAVDIANYRIIQQNLQESIETTNEFIKNNLEKEIIIGEGTKRKEKFEYPLEVIREATVNAVVHRDYFNKEAIQINIFTDRLEIISPGTLPEGLTRELFGQLSVRRNQKIYSFLRDLGFVEGLGTGVPRMKNAMRKAGLEDPTFDIQPSFFRVILRNQKGNLQPIEKAKDLNDRQKKALRYVIANKTIKTKVYEKINGVSQGTANKDIREMVDFGYLTRNGKFRGTYYTLGEKADL